MTTQCPISNESQRRARLHESVRARANVVVVVVFATMDGMVTRAFLVAAVTALRANCRRAARSRERHSASHTLHTLRRDTSARRGCGVRGIHMLPHCGQNRRSGSRASCVIAPGWAAPAILEPCVSTDQKAHRVTRKHTHRLPRRPLAGQRHTRLHRPCQKLIIFWRDIAGYARKLDMH